MSELEYNDAVKEIYKLIAPIKMYNLSGIRCGIRCVMWWLIMKAPSRNG